MTVPENQTILNEFPYLNQTAHYIFNSSSIAAQLFNVPYRTLRSLADSVVERYRQSTEARETEMPSTLMVSMGYFFSFYSIGCFVVAVVLNRLITMSSLRSTNHAISISTWAKVSLHALSLIAIAYALFRTGAQYGLYDQPQDISAFLSSCYLTVCLSHCVETFVTTTTNSKPLEESDYSIFELSSQFYMLTQLNSGVEEYGVDCLMCLAGRFIIHLVELLNIRKYRIILSTMINVPFIFFMGYRHLVPLDISSLPMLSKFRHFPKILSISIILLSYVCFKLSCIVRMNPFDQQNDYLSGVEELQFYSFWNDWYNNLNLSGEEEFSYAAMKLAILLCNPQQTKKNGIHRELMDVNYPSSLQKTYLISGYANKVDEDAYEILDLKRDVRSNSAWFIRLNWFLTMSKHLLGWFQYLWKKSDKEEFVPEIERDLNDFVTEKNYYKFFHVDNSKSAEMFLLPEEDNSETYAPLDSDLDDEGDDESDESNESDDVNSDADPDIAHSEQDNQLSIIQELFTPEQIQELVMSPRDMSWYLSAWSILNHESMADSTILTRRQYAQQNERDLLQEIISERSPRITEVSTDNYKDETDMSCVVCKTNSRNIILWPCKCFALCENCRMSLGLRGFNTCICCRREVKGYSKLNIV